jgi:GT2 family glycosyltransferase
VTAGSPDAVSAVIVSYSDPSATRAAVVSLGAQTVAPLEVLVVDNHPAAPARAALEGLDVTVLTPERNLGFAGAVDLAARSARGAWLLLLNPDAVAEPECVQLLLEAAGRGVAIVGAQVLLSDGARVNAGDNPVHLTGLSWSGRYLRPREDGPARDVACVSGAAMLVRAAAFGELGGFPPGFFVYHEDVDLAWRARAAGWRVRFCPAARVRHDYDFDKGPAKWFWLERNRLWTVLTNYEARTLVRLAPLLVATEAAILASAWRGGWLRPKLRAYAALARALPSLLRWRARVQRGRAVPDAVLVGALTARIETPVLDGPLVRAANPWMERYRRVAFGSPAGD